MKLLDRYRKKKEELSQKALEIQVESLQKRDEKIRKQKQLAEPGTIKYGMVFKQNPIDFTHDSINRRKMLREEKRRKQP